GWRWFGFTKSSLGSFVTSVYPRESAGDCAERGWRGRDCSGEFIYERTRAGVPDTSMSYLPSPLSAPLPRHKELCGTLAFSRRRQAGFYADIAARGTSIHKYR